jgi:mRNA-degrading endonuclease RelE of RelBE toxin-antitoxin system
VNHRTTKQFWKLYERLPDHIKKLADKNFELLKNDREHSSLRFKKIEDMWSVRVGAHYRALGFDHQGQVLWFWIGSHAEYDKLMP